MDIYKYVEPGTPRWAAVAIAVLCVAAERLEPLGKLGWQLKAAYREIFPDTPEGFLQEIAFLGGLIGVLVIAFS